MSSSNVHNDDTAPPRRKLGPRALIIIALFFASIITVTIFLISSLIDTVTAPLSNDSESTSTTVSQNVDSSSANTPPLEPETVN